MFQRNHVYSISAMELHYIQDVLKKCALFKMAIIWDRKQVEI